MVLIDFVAEPLLSDCLNLQSSSLRYYCVLSTFFAAASTTFLASCCNLAHCVGFKISHFSQYFAAVHLKLCSHFYSIELQHFSIFTGPIFS